MKKKHIRREGIHNLLFKFEKNEDKLSEMRTKNSNKKHEINKNVGMTERKTSVASYVKTE